MLSIGKLSAGQESYYEQQVAQGRDDYYSGRGETSGEWLGGGARELGLEGEVDAAAFAALMSGADPRSGQEVRARRGSVAGFDLTFSAPKSVSVLFVVGDTPTSRALVEAHHEAVGAAVRYLEAEACWVRRGAGGEQRLRGGGFVAAAYRHRMSRAEDPQLHTHVVTANVSREEDGRFSALDGRALYTHAKAGGFLYQAHLRAAVRERLPWVEWGAVRNGMAEITGVPEGVLREFSTRRLEILERERELAAAGVAVGHAGRERVTHDTRRRKRHGIETAPWQELIRARAAEHGLGAAELRDLTAGAVVGARPGTATVAEEAERLVGPSGLTEKRNTFAMRDAVIGFARAHDQGAGADHVIAAAERFCERPDVLPIGESSGEAIFTTNELLACEEAIVGSAAGRRDDRVGLVAGDDVERVLASRSQPLNDEQAAAVRGIVQSGRGVDTIEALAGTGKTTTAAALADVYRSAGYSVLGVAPTGRAVRELKERAGIDSWTLARLLMRLDRYGDRFPAGRSVLIIDEAGMASTREVARLLTDAERSHVKVVAIGDPGQLPSVHAGGWLGSLSRRFGSYRLLDVMRQRDPGERRLLERLHAGEPDAYLCEKQASGLLRLYEGNDAGLAGERAAVAAWHARQAHLPDGQAILMCRDNDRRRRLNHAARALLAREGRLGPAVLCGGREFAVGDHVICRRNAPALDVDNGTRATVIHVDENGGTVRLRTDAGAERALPAPYCAQHLEHAYALTAHGAQGATVEWAAVVGNPDEFSRNWSYTALSRSRDRTEIFVISTPAAWAADRVEIAPGERSAGPGSRERLARAMRQRDDQELAFDRIGRGKTVERHERGIQRDGRRTSRGLEL